MLKSFDTVLMPWFFRMTKLLDEEVEEDELFWNQDALKEVDVHIVCYKLLTIICTYIFIMFFLYVKN